MTFRPMSDLNKRAGRLPDQGRIRLGQQVATNNWCGHVAVATPYGNYWSAHGCATYLNNWHVTVPVWLHYPTPGPLNVWAIGDPGQPNYRDGFYIG